MASRSSDWANIPAFSGTSGARRSCRSAEAPASGSAQRGWLTPGSLAPPQQLLDDQVRGFVGRHLCRVDADFGVLRLLVRAVDAGEILELAGAGLGIEALGVALLGFGERRIDKDLEELALGNHPPDHVPLGPERRDEGRQHDETRVGHEPRDLADAADVLDAVGLSEAEIAVEAVAHVVTVEQESVPSARGELLFDEIGDGRLAGARETCEPQYRRLLALEV